MLKLKGIDDKYFDSWEEFVASEAVAEGVRKKLKVNDIIMPEGYRIRSRNTFIRGVVSELSRHLKEAFLQHSKSDFGEPVLPMLGQKAFLELPLIQIPLKKAFKLSDDQAPVLLNLSEAQFRDQVLMPVITKELEKQRTGLLASAIQFLDGAEKEAIGKQYVRSVLVPPIAMGFSMFFALWNLTKVASSIWQLRGKSEKHAIFFQGGFLILVVVIPLFVFSGEIAQTKTFQSIESETSKAIGPLGSGFIIWLSNLQPIVYPLGHFLADSLNIFTSIEVENR